MTEELLILQRDERENSVAICTDPLDEFGLGRRRECFPVHGIDGAQILGPFKSDHQFRRLAHFC